MNEITLKQWAKEELERLANFIALWEKSAKDKPEQYPDTLSSGDWDEQFLAFTERLL